MSPTPQAFITSTPLPHSHLRLHSKCAAIPAHTRAPPARHAPSSLPTSPTTGMPVTTTATSAATTMQQQKTAKAAQKNQKKRAPVVYSTDIKGNIVWTLRSATPDDVDGIHALVEQVLPRELVSAFVENNTFCTVAEASVKGSKEGEGYKSIIAGTALVDVNLCVLKPEPKVDDLQIVKKAQLVTIAVSEGFPDADASKKLLLGSLKKMKDGDVVEVEHAVDIAERVELVKECLFKEQGKTGTGLPRFTCNLVSENPDPKKKMM